MHSAMLAIGLAIPSVTFAPPDEVARPQGGTLRIAFVCIRLSDLPDIRRTCNEWESFLESEANPYFSAFSDQNFQIDLIQPPSALPKTNGFFDTIRDSFRDAPSQDGVGTMSLHPEYLKWNWATITESLDLSSFDYLLYLLNNNTATFAFGRAPQYPGKEDVVVASEATGGENPDEAYRRLQLDPSDPSGYSYGPVETVWIREMGVARVDIGPDNGVVRNVEEVVETLIHEVFHMVGINGHYGSIDYTEADGTPVIPAATRDRVMDTTVQGAVDRGRPKHPFVWDKVNAGWREKLDGTLSNVDTIHVPPGGSGTYDLMAHTGVQAPSKYRHIFLVQGEAIPKKRYRLYELSGISIEARIDDQNLDHIHESGVLAIRHSLSGGATSTHVVEYTDDPAFQPGGSPFLQVGDTYTFEDGSTVDVVMQHPDGSYRVSVSNGFPTQAPDIDIVPWGTQRSPPGMDWESPDIWVNSRCANGFDELLRPGPNNDGIGNGDPLCLPEAKETNGTEVNRLCIRSRNRGSPIFGASGALISVQYSEPHAGGSASQWKPVRHLVGGLESDLTNYPLAGNFYSGAEVTNCYDWVLRAADLVSQHACVRVTISAATGEAFLENNQAEENFSDIETYQNSPWHEFDFTFRAGNPTPINQAISFSLSGVPQGWGVTFDPPIAYVAPNSSIPVIMTMQPSGPASTPFTGIQEPGLNVPINVTAIGTEDDARIQLSGFTMVVKLAEQTTLQLQAAGFDPTPPAGALVTISGNLSVVSGSGSVTGEKVTVRAWSNTAGSPAYGTFTVDANGNYGGSLQIPSSGTWNMRARYAGTDLLGESESGVVTVTIP